jgi:FKBP-type peptidyl-prolyl cis-trans isomerase
MGQTRAARAALRAGVALAAAATIAVLAGCGSSVSVTPLCTNPTTQSTPDQFSASVSLLTLPYGLKYGDVSTGCGQQVRVGDQVAVAYTGWLSDGSEFDSSRDPGRQPLVFALGEQQVLRGFDLGVMGMRVGGRRRIVVPPLLGYGAEGVPPVIPSNATLIIDVQVLGASR